MLKYIIALSFLLFAGTIFPTQMYSIQTAVAQDDFDEEDLDFEDEDDDEEEESFSEDDEDEEVDSADSDEDEEVDSADSDEDELDLDDEFDDEESEGDEGDVADEDEDFSEEELETADDEDNENPEDLENIEPLSEEEIEQDDVAEEQFQEELEADQESAEAAPIVNEGATGEEFSTEEDQTAETEVSQSDTAMDTGPDLEYEAKLHSIYLNFHKGPTAEEEWKTLVEGREAEIYEIRTGDTLWGISQLFFGDGNYWPKIWSLNSRIGNPHLISSGHSIGFVLGNESEAPSFTVTEGDGSELNGEAEESTAEVTDGESGVEENTETVAEDEQEADENGPDIPPPGVVSAPVVKRLPPSLPILRSFDRKSAFGKSGMNVIPRKVPIYEPQVTLSSYVDSEDIDALGSLIEVETGYKVASLFQYVYVKVKAGEARVGDSLLIVQDQGNLVTPEGIYSDRDEHQYQVQGVLKLIDITKLDRSSEDSSKPVEHFRALITEMIEPVTTGAKLISGKIERYPVNLDGPRSRVVAQIIGGSQGVNMRLFTEGSIAYLNRGKVDGVARGQVLAIRENRKMRREYSKVEENLRPIGWLKILNTSKKYSTAVIVQAWDGINIGDLTGLGEMLPRSKVMASSEESSKKKSGDEDDELDDSDEYEYVDEDAEEGDEDDEYVDEDAEEGDEDDDEYADDGDDEESLVDEVASDLEDEEEDEGDLDEANNDEDDVDSLLDDEEDPDEESEEL